MSTDIILTEVRLPLDVYTGFMEAVHDLAPEIEDHIVSKKPAGKTMRIEFKDLSESLSIKAQILISTISE